VSRVGIKDIAAEAGVSTATVSHALRNSGRVSELTRKKVLAAAQKAGYTPNRLAANLRTSRSGNIVVIIPDVADSFNGQIITGIEQVARSKGYSVLLGNTGGSPNREREFAEMTRSRQADGIILMSHRMPFDVSGGIDGLPPLVNGCENTDVAGIPRVAVRDRRAARDATRHLLEYGHEKIAVVTGDMESASSRARLDGFRTGMRDAGIDVNEDWVIHGNYQPEDGERAARRLMSLRSRPTAVFCFSDEMAMGCMHALRELGFDVPHDVSVMGFDGVPLSRYTAPPLTTIAQPAEEIGAACARILLGLIEGEKPDCLETFLPHELVVRGSTAPLKRDRV